jgi:CheY-like chemotaxis protein
MTKNSRENKQEKKVTILVVDDERIFLNCIDFELRSRGSRYSPIFALDALEGLRVFKEKKPDLVITDLRMPNVDGLEFLTMLKKEDASTPVIMITAHADRMTLAETIKMGASDYLVKPYDTDELINVIENTLSKSKMQRDLDHYKKLSDALDKENKMLKERIARLSETKDGGLIDKELEKYRAICGAVAHGLKGEFMHIGYSLKEIRESGNTSPDILEESDVIDRSLSYCELLLQRLRNYLDMGSLQREPIDVLELIKKTEVLARPHLPSNIQLQIKVAPNLKMPKIFANSEQIMGIILELINNAVEVLRPKGGTIEIEPGVRNRKVIISVKDDGPGFPANLRKKILKEQVPSKSGLGLGLFLINKVISEFGGELDLKTGAGKGTTFKIAFSTIEDKKET